MASKPKPSEYAISIGKVPRTLDDGEEEQEEVRRTEIDTELNVLDLNLANRQRLATKLHQ